MSKKLNLMVEVEDDLYANIVIPHKRNKTFSKLLSTLIKGYAENMYIRGYVEDTLEGMRRSSSAALEDLIGSMKEGLANMGMYTDELKNNAQEGVDIFERKKQEAEGSLNTSAIKEIVGAETKELREAVGLLQSQNEAMMDMLRSLSTSGFSASAQSYVNTKEQSSIKVENTSKEKDSSISNNVLHEEIDDVVPLQEAEDQTEAIIPLQEVEEEKVDVDGEDVLSNLLMGQMFNY